MKPNVSVGVFVTEILCNESLCFTVFLAAWVGASDDITDILQVVGLTQLIHCFATMEEASAAMQADMAA